MGEHWRLAFKNPTDVYRMDEGVRFRSYLRIGLAHSSQFKDLLVCRSSRYKRLDYDCNFFNQ